ncbi:hypothetical protein QCA50_002793 [Cerrena zonata]|uniref:Blue (type 1) copper domain-containing protein n=1 Tax=Cerrena zonata TaxID=2478898 RepID=A0AAW0GMU2_9APHY
MITTAFTILILPLLALASPQLYGPPPPPANDPTPTSASVAVAAAAPSAPPDSPGQMNVDVGFQETFTFHPSNFSAPNGTTITFFFPADLQHTVVEGDPTNPCAPLAGGFDSSLTASSQFTITVTDDTRPVYFFCKVLTHCPAGMVGVINENKGNVTFAQYQAAAMALGNTQPSVDQNNAPITGGIGAQATAGPSSDIASAAPSPTSGGSGTSGATRVAVTGFLGLLVVVMSAMLAL